MLTPCLLQTAPPTPATLTPLNSTPMPYHLLETPKEIIRLTIMNVFSTSASAVLQREAQLDPLERGGHQDQKEKGAQQVRSFIFCRITFNLTKGLLLTCCVSQGCQVKREKSGPEDLQDQQDYLGPMDSMATEVHRCLTAGEFLNVSLFLCLCPSLLFCKTLLCTSILWMSFSTLYLSKPPQVKRVFKDLWVFLVLLGFQENQEKKVGGYSEGTSHNLLYSL